MATWPLDDTLEYGSAERALSEAEGTSACEKDMESDLGFNREKCWTSGA
jgi:hypothetical protein